MISEMIEIFTFLILLHNDISIEVYPGMSVITPYYSAGDQNHAGLMI